MLCAEWVRNSCHIYGNNAMETIYKSKAILRTKDTLYKYSHPYSQSHPHPSSISDQLFDLSSCSCWTLLELIIKIADVARGICCVAKPKVQQEKSLFQQGGGCKRGTEATWVEICFRFLCPLNMPNTIFIFIQYARDTRQFVDFLISQLKGKLRNFRNLLQLPFKAHVLRGRITVNFSG